MEKLCDIVGFKNRKIYQNDDFFCFNLDSLLLSYYIKIKESDKNILELGVGNGVNLLILSSKYKQNMFGIDIQKENINLAEKSIKYNKLENQIVVQEMNIIDCYKVLGNDKYDVILCNPPYYDKSSINKTKVKSNSKSEQIITLNDILNEVSKLLINKGKFYMIYPVNNLENVIKLCNNNKLTIKKIRFVYYDKTKNSNLMLLEIRKNANKGLEIERPLILYEGKEKTEEYKKMLGEV